MAGSNRTTLIVVSLVACLALPARADEPEPQPSYASRAGLAYVVGLGVASAANFLVLTLGAPAVFDPETRVAALGVGLLAPPVLTTLVTALLWTEGRRLLDANATMLAIGLHALALALTFFVSGDLIPFSWLLADCLLMPLATLWQVEPDPPPVRASRRVADARPIDRALGEGRSASGMSLASVRF